LCVARLETPVAQHHLIDVAADLARVVADPHSYTERDSCRMGFAA
jgi:hypothetical protein